MDKIASLIPKKLNLNYSPASTSVSDDSRRVRDSHDVAKFEANRYDQHYEALDSGNVVTITDKSDNRITISPIMIDNSQHTHIIGNVLSSAGFSEPENSEPSNQTKPQEATGNVLALSETDEPELKIADLKPVILISKMNSDMEELATNFVVGAFVKSNNDKVRARQICDSLEKLYKESWHCVVGSDFTNCVSYEENSYIHLKIANQRVLIFKTPSEACVKQLQDSSKKEINQLQVSFADEIKQLKTSLKEADISMQASEKCQATIKEYRTEIDRVCSVPVEDLTYKHVELQLNAIKKFDEWNNMKVAGMVLKQRHDFIKTMTDEIFSTYDERNKERIKFENKPVWEKAYDGETPDGAVFGCKEGKFVSIVARVNYEGHILPGKYLPYYNYCCVPYNGGELKIHKYEVLCHTKVDWVKMNRNQRLPPNALPGGKTKAGEILHIGRATHIGKGNVKLTILGKVDQNSMCCISYYGTEYKYLEYELLVIKQD